MTARRTPTRARTTCDTDTARTSPPTMTSATSTDDDALHETAAAPCGFASLPPHVISKRILTPDFLPEPGDLGRLRAVSHWMRDAVDATGRKIEKLSNEDAVKLGHLSLVKDRHSRGVLKDERLLCAAAAAKGDLEALKGLHAKNCPWDWRTCANLAKGGHLEVLKWAYENYCPWNSRTCAYAAKGGHLEVLKLARENGCPWTGGRARTRRRATTLRCCDGRARTAARGTRTRAHSRLRRATSKPEPQTRETGSALRTREPSRQTTETRRTI